MPILEDKEFGRVTVRRTSGSSMRASVAPNGTLRLSVPNYAPMFMVRRMIAGSRDELRRLFESRPSLKLQHGMPIGKSYTLLIRRGNSLTIRRQGQQLILTLGEKNSTADKDVVELVRHHMRIVLRKEAKAHLPNRLEHLSKIHGFSFTALRFTHASTRWGSCNSNRAISLNIALMTLPFELIDYVLLHELAHTKHMNHSTSFWLEVERVDPHYIKHRKKLKQYNPSI